jgi:hypothetical protein
METKKILKK